MGAILQGVSEAAGPLPGGYGVVLLQTMLALFGVSVLAWVVLRWGARRGWSSSLGGGRLRIIERMALDHRRSLYLVSVGKRVLLIGTGDHGAPATLAELDPEAIPLSSKEPRTGSFAEILSRLGGKGRAQ